MRRIVGIAVMLMVVGSTSAQKEYRQIREKIKKSDESAITLIENTLKNEKFKNDPELLHYGVESWLKTNEAVNQKAYLKQQYDTTKLFNSIYGMYNYAVRCDTMEAYAARLKGKDKVSYKYRSSHGDLLRSQYTNLYNGGQFMLLKKDFANAYNFFSMYYDIRSNPVFGKLKASQNDSTQLRRAAYWATVCAYQLNDNAKFFKYNEAAMLDSTYRQKELELTARLYKAAKDTARLVGILQTGAKEYPQHDYFFTNLIDYYNNKGEFEKAMELSENILKYDPRSLMAQYGKSLVMLKMKRYDECIALANSIIQSDSTYSEAYYNAGAAYLAQATETHAKVKSNMLLDEIRSIKREGDKLMRKALPFLEHYRKLNPNSVEWWGRPLYNIYLALNMAEKFEEVEKVIAADEKAKADAAKAAAQKK